MKGFQLRMVCVLSVLATVNAAPAGAQAVSVLHAFGPSPKHVSELIQVSDGSFYGIGVISFESSARAIFRMKPGGRPTVLHTLRGEGGE